MSDVTLSYKGSDILELSDSGSATLKTGGTYCEADIEVEYVKPSGGGNLIATGEVTLASNGQFPTITHNLGTQRIAGVVYPVGDLVVGAGYATWRVAFVNTSALIGAEQSFSLDFTSYNTHFSEPVELTTNNTELWDGVSSHSPWGTQSVWQSYANSSNARAKQDFSYTNNSVSISTGNARSWPVGTYRYVIIGVM